MDDVQQELAVAFEKDRNLLWVELKRDNKEKKGRDSSEFIGFEAEPKAGRPKLCFTHTDWAEAEIVEAGGNRRRASGTFIPCVMAGKPKKGATVLNVEPAWAWQPDGLLVPEGQVDQMASLMGRNLAKAKERFFKMLAPFHSAALIAQEEFDRLTTELRESIAADYDLERVGADLLDEGVHTWKVKRKDGESLDETKDATILDYLGRMADVDEDEREVAAFENSSFATDMAGETAALVTAGYRFVQFDKLAG